MIPYELAPVVLLGLQAVGVPAGMVEAMMEIERDQYPAKGRRGEYHRERLGQRQQRQQAAICPGCYRGGWHDAGCPSRKQTGEPDFAATEGKSGTMQNDQQGVSHGE